MFLGLAIKVQWNILKRKKRDNVISYIFLVDREQQEETHIEVKRKHKKGSKKKKGKGKLNLTNRAIQKVMNWNYSIREDSVENKTEISRMMR